MAYKAPSLKITPQPDKVFTKNMDLGDFVQNVSLKPYIKARDIDFIANGLKPNTRVWAFFQSVPVSQYVYPYTGTLTQGQMTISTFGNIGDPLITDSGGRVAGRFHMPSGQFTSDQIEFMIQKYYNEHPL